MSESTFSLFQYSEEATEWKKKETKITEIEQEKKKLKLFEKENAAWLNENLLASIRNKKIIKNQKRNLKKARPEGQFTQQQDAILKATWFRRR